MLKRCSVLSMNVVHTADAEMHALRGALLEALWAVDKTNIPFADQALKAFEKSFVMCNDVHEPVLAGIGYGLARYDKISTRVALLSLVVATLLHSTAGILYDAHSVCHMCYVSTSQSTISAALLSAQLYQLESTSARGNRKVAEIWKTQATERLRKLHDALLFWQKKKPSM